MHVVARVRCVRGAPRTHTHTHRVVESQYSTLLQTELPILIIAMLVPAAFYIWSFRPLVNFVEDEKVRVFTIFLAVPPLLLHRLRHRFSQVLRRIADLEDDEDEEGGGGDKFGAGDDDSVSRSDSNSNSASQDDDADGGAAAGHDASTAKKARGGGGNNSAADGAAGAGAAGVGANKSAAALGSPQSQSRARGGGGGRGGAGGGGEGDAQPSSPTLGSPKRGGPSRTAGGGGGGMSSPSTSKATRRIADAAATIGPGKKSNPLLAGEDAAAASNPAAAAREQQRQLALASGGGVVELSVVDRKLTNAREMRRAGVCAANAKMLVLLALIVGYCLAALLYTDMVFVAARADSDTVGYSADRVYYVQKLCLFVRDFLLGCTECVSYAEVQEALGALKQVIHKLFIGVPNARIKARLTNRQGCCTAAEVQQTTVAQRVKDEYVATCPTYAGGILTHGLQVTALLFERIGYDLSLATMQGALGANMPYVGGGGGGGGANNNSTLISSNVLVVNSAEYNSTLRDYEFFWDLGSVYLRASYGVATTYFREDAMTEVHATQGVLIIMTSVFLGVVGAMCIFYYYPMFRAAEDDLKDCRAMIQVIPPDMLQSVAGALASFLTVSTNNNGGGNSGGDKKNQ